MTHTHPGAGLRRGPLAVLLTGTFLIVLDFFVVNVALPPVQRDLTRTCSPWPPLGRPRHQPNARVACRHGGPASAAA